MQEAKGNVLPKLTQDIQQCRRDLDKWGYCLIDKCCSDAQVAMYQQRLREQAEAELLAGVNNGPSRPSMRQNVWSLINKGGDSRMFEDFLEFNPRSMQGGPLAEQLIAEQLNTKSFTLQSLQCFIAYKMGHPQPLHQDQSYSPFQTPEAPIQTSLMIMISDVGPKSTRPVRSVSPSRKRSDTQPSRLQMGARFLCLDPTLSSARTVLASRWTSSRPLSTALAPLGRASYSMRGACTGRESTRRTSHATS